MRWFQFRQKQTDTLDELVTEVRELRSEVSNIRDKLSLEISTLRQQTNQSLAELGDRSDGNGSIWSIVAWIVPSTAAIGGILWFLELFRNQTRDNPVELVFSIFELVVAVSLLVVNIKLQFLLIASGTRQVISAFEYESLRLAVITTYMAIMYPLSRWIYIAIERSDYAQTYGAIVRVTALIGFLAAFGIAIRWIPRVLRSMPPNDASALFKWATPRELFVCDAVITFTVILLMTTIEPWLTFTGAAG